MTYTVPKRVFSKNSIIDRIVVFFSNGDYLTIRKNEVCNISITFYDRLIKKGMEFHPIGQGGFIKLRIQSGKAKGESRLLHNENEYVKNRKKYIENRMVTDSCIESVVLYNQLNWSDRIYGDIYATLEGEYLYIRFKENERYGTWESDSHYVDIAPPSKKLFFKINLDFENCDGIDVYNHEIKEMDLVFSDKLYWNSNGYGRRVIGGSLLIKLEDFRNRNIQLYYNVKKPKLKHIERRLCGKNGIDMVDICHLYLEYYRHIGESGERIGVDSLIEDEKTETPKTIDDFGDYYAEDRNWDYEDEEEYVDEDEYEPFESGYAKKLDDGSILIVFGKRITEK